jgi:hypothetical protein
MTTMLATVIGAVIGAAATLTGSWWTARAGRRGAELAEVANRRADAAEHRAAVTALLAAAYALDTWYQRNQPGDGDRERAELEMGLELAAALVTWPPSSPKSAHAAQVVYLLSGAAEWVPSRMPFSVNAFQAALRMFTETAAGEPV